MSDANDEGLLVARVVIERRLTDHGGDEVSLQHSRGDDAEPLPLVEALGLLRLSEDTALRMAMDDDGDDT